MDQVISMAAKEGIWVLLFCSFFYYQLKANEKREAKYIEREEKYHELLHQLADKFNILNEVHTDIKDVKSKIDLIRGGKSENNN